MNATTLQERMMIQELSRSGMSDRRIGEQLRLSLSTIRKWRRKGQVAGAIGLVSMMGRPVRGSMSTFSPALVNQLRFWREAHPGWGPKTLRTELGLAPSFAAQRLPSRATIGRWLKQEKRVRPYAKHQDLPDQQAAPVQACHEEWEMDARGQERIPDVGVICLINLNDVFSRVKVMSYPCWLGEERAHRHPTTTDYQLVLRLAFVEWGLPERLAVDHESVFYDNSSKSPFPTRLHLWLLALGIRLTFGRPHQPRDQAITERSHQTWQHQVLDGQVFGGWEALWQALQKRRTFLNWELPCVSLGEFPPLLAHPEACHSQRPYRPECEAELLDLTHIYAYLGQGRWFRKASNVGAVTLGEHRYSLGKACIKKEVEITFDPTDQHFVFQSPAAAPKRLPAQGLTLLSLVGEPQTPLHLNGLQLMLPLSWDDWRSLQSFELRG